MPVILSAPISEQALAGLAPDVALDKLREAIRWAAPRSRGDIERLWRNAVVESVPFRTGEAHGSARATVTAVRGGVEIVLIGVFYIRFYIGRIDRAQLLAEAASIIAGIAFKRLAQTLEG
ncbi:MAG: hypothetical protein OXI45_13670 [Acidobacteriota bacterium]|nr:hypothetical protein [Acidobacteriota bacterium]